MTPINYFDLRSELLPTVIPIEIGTGDEEVGRTIVSVGREILGLPSIIENESAVS